MTGIYDTIQKGERSRREMYQVGRPEDAPYHVLYNPGGKKPAPKSEIAEYMKKNNITYEDEDAAFPYGYPASGAIEYSNIDPVLFGTGIGATMMGLRAGNFARNLLKATADEFSGGGTNTIRAGVKQLKGSKSESIGNLIEAGQRMAFNAAYDSNSPATELFLLY